MSREERVTVNFDPPLQIHAIPSEPSLQFETLEQFQEWARDQSRRWDEIRERFIHDLSDNAHSCYGICSLQKDGWRRLSYSYTGMPSFLSPFAQESGPLPFDFMVGRFISESRLIVADNPIVFRALQFIGSDFDVARCLLYIATDRLKEFLRPPGNSLTEWYLFSKAIAVLFETNALGRSVQEAYSMTSRAQDVVRSVDVDRASVVSKAELKLKAISQYGKNTVKAAAEQRSEIQQEWERLRATYDNELKLRAPREYWAKKLADHRRFSLMWLTGFMSVIVLAVAVLGVALWQLPAVWKGHASDLGTIAWIVPACMIGVPAFVFLWLLRICGRQWSDQMIRQEDARERIVMVETYLALTRDNDSPNTIADPAQVVIVLNSLFRPGPGFATDDSPPAGIIEALLAKIGSQKGG